MREPRTAPLSEEGRRQAVAALAALAVMIGEWWSGSAGIAGLGKPVPGALGAQAGHSTL